MTAVLALLLPWLLPRVVPQMYLAAEPPLLVSPSPSLLVPYAAAPQLLFELYPLASTHPQYAQPQVLASRVPPLVPVPDPLASDALGLQEQSATQHRLRRVLHDTFHSAPQDRVSVC